MRQARRQNLAYQSAMIQIRGASGNARVFGQIRNIPKSFNLGIKKANIDIGREISKEAKRTIKEDKKTGRLYILQDKFTGQLRLHRASARGESPANFSGALAASIGYVPSVEKLIIGAGGTNPLITTGTGQIGFGDLVNYAKRLELGGRPYLKPSIVKKQKDTENYYYQAIGRELEKL
jgi:hypothetical protein